MQILIRKISGKLYSSGFLVRGWRSSRMHTMDRLLDLPSGARIVDLGGSEYNWGLFEHDYHVTLVNLPGLNPPVSDPDRFDHVEGDACNLREIFEDHAFDAAFSNSTIEHVGDEGLQAAFAAEVRRLGQAYWVQTPSSRFPIEVHCGVPFYWKLPGSARKAFLDRWQRTLPGWTEMMRETRVLTRRRMQELFPDGNIYTERCIGIEKSYASYKPYLGPR